MAKKKNTKISKDSLYTEVEGILGNSWAGAGDKCKSLLHKLYERNKELEDSSMLQAKDEEIAKLKEENMVLKSRMSLIKSICKVPAFYRTEEQSKEIEESD